MALRPLEPESSASANSATSASMAGFLAQALYWSKENLSGKGSWGFLRRVFLLLVSFPNQWEGRPTTTLSSIHFMRGESDPFPCSYLSVWMPTCQSPIVHLSTISSVQIDDLVMEHRSIVQSLAKSKQKRHSNTTINPSLPAVLPEYCAPPDVPSHTRGSEQH